MFSCSNRKIRYATAANRSLSLSFALAPPATMSDDRSINAEISGLRQLFKNGFIAGERFYDYKHELLMRLKNPPQAALAHENTRVRVGAFYYYKDAVTKRLFRTSLDGRIYLDDELKQPSKQ
jgi:hypothetical protein